MKRFAALTLSLIMILSLAACGLQKDQISKEAINWMEFAKEALAERVAQNKLDYSSDEYWYQTGNEFDENKIDVFYFLSTTLLKAVDENGDPAMNSTLSKEDREIMQWEYNYMATEMFDPEHFNFIAPYYRQMTFETYSTTDKKAGGAAILRAVADACTAFDYYMEHLNNGRPFIIAGFSQGGIMTQMALLHMTDEQYSRLIAAYSMGFQVTEKELAHPHIKPAVSADDTGVIVSYNSVESTATMWDSIEGKAAICINPLNWKTDATPAELVYDGDKATVHVDKEHQVLIVEGLDSNKYDGLGYPLEKGVYHMWDIRFYADAINKNAIHRAELFMKKS